MFGREGRAVAFDLGTSPVGGQRHVAFVDLGAGDPGVVVEHVPARVDATGQVELHAGGVALARQQFLLGGGVGVGVALVVLLRVEQRHTQGGALLEQLELATQLEVAALLRPGVGEPVARCCGAELVGVARGVVRGAEGHVVGRHVAGLVQRTQARAPEVFAAAELACGRDRAVGGGGFHRLVRGIEAVKAHAADELDGVGHGHRVLGIQADVARLEGVERGVAARVGTPVAVVGVAHRGGQAAAAAGEVVVALGVFVVQVHTGDQLVFFAQGIELLRQVALQLGDVAGAHAAFGRAGDDGVWSQVGGGGGLAVGLAETDHARPEVAFVTAVAHAGQQLGVVVEAVFVGEGEVVGRAVLVIAVQAIEVLGRQGGLDHAVAGEPGVVVAGAAVYVQVVQAHLELVARADAPTVGGGHAVLAAGGAIVVGVVQHGVDAQRRVFAGLFVEIAGQAVLAARAQGVGHLVLVHQEGALVHLVDDATGGALAEQHGRRAFEHLHALVVEGVAFVQHAVAHAVHIDVAGLAQREAAQAHVFFTGFACQEGHACRRAQHLAEIVEVAVVDQALGHHRHRLRDVAQGLCAFADLGVGGAQAGFGGSAVGLLFHGHGGQRGRVLLGGRGLGHGAHGAGQQHCTQWEQHGGGREGGGVRAGGAAGLVSGHAQVNRRRVVGWLAGGMSRWRGWLELEV